MKLFSTTTTTTTATALLLALNFFFSAISFANVGAAVVVDVDDDGDEVLSSSSWKVLDNAFLPTPLSDNTATYIPASSSSSSGTTNSAAPSVPARIYISGGCDSPRGNTYVDANGLELDFFMCESISSKLYGFIPATTNKSTTTDTDVSVTDTVNTTEGRNGNGDDVQGSGGGGSSIVVTLTDMPRPRYRHSAVATSDGKLWLIGGRTIPDDTIIPEVDVYDPVTNTWTTVGTIPNEYLTSDSGAFTNGDKTKIYVVGGYNQNYFNPDSLSTTFMFDTTEINNKALVQNQNNANIADSSTTTDIIVTKMADLNNPRGDIHAVTITTSSSSSLLLSTSTDDTDTDTDTTDNGNGNSNGNGDTTKAYVAGGFTAMCQPLKSVEVYDIDNDKWEFLGGVDDGNGDLLSARGDQAMVATQSNGRIYAIGGEVSHPNQCAAPELVPPLSAQSLAVDDVEVYDTTAGDDSNNNEWIDIVDIPEFRFRFTAAAWPASSDDNNKDDGEQVFAFGGQTSFDESCKCFPTSNEITTIIRSTTSTTAATGSGSGSGILLTGDTNNDVADIFNVAATDTSSSSSTTNASWMMMMWMFSTVVIVVVM